MKKSISITFALLAFVFLTSMIMNTASGRSSLEDSKISKPISSDVMKIADRSCVKCHTDGGNRMALMHFNMSKWNDFSPKKQARKAKEMCKMVSNGKMPPKDFREEHPGASPTINEVKIICDWATSIQIEKK